MTPNLSTSDAYQYLVDNISKFANYGYDVYIPRAMDAYIEQAFKGDVVGRLTKEQVSRPFLDAAWELCRRGIIRPGIKCWGQQTTDEGGSGNGFSITPFGVQWLSEAGSKYEYIPVEPGRFGQLLAGFSDKFGSGYHERAQQALRCYGAHAYLACCAMCGAASESITLAIAILKSGDEQKTLNEYTSSGGRGRIEKAITGKVTDPIREEFKTYAGLLKYWRDASSHGKATNIQENEAFTSLALLLRFAQFVSDRWAELTTT